MKYRNLLNLSINSRKKTGAAANARRLLGLLPVFPLIFISFLNLFLLPSAAQVRSSGSSSLSGNSYHLQSLDNHPDSIFLQVAGIIPETGVSVTTLAGKLYVSPPSLYTVTKPWSQGIRAPPFHV